MMSFNSSPLSAMPLLALDSRSRWVVLTLLLVLAGTGWFYLIYMTWAMQNMGLVEMWMPPDTGMRVWQSSDFLMLLLMWVLMMAAMMLPSTLPMVFLFASVQKKLKQTIAIPTVVFISAYLVAWTIYSVIVTVLQWQLHVNGLLNPMMDSRSYLWSGIVLIVAGLYQWTSLKEACLNQCRSPLSFLMASWRSGHWGAFQMGMRHGFYCVGCCWALMGILFAVGVMNMLWIVILSIFALLEKTLLPLLAGRIVVGLILVVWGAWWLALYPW